MKNARILEQRGGAVVFPEAELTAEKLYQTVKELLGDGKKQEKMSEALRAAVVKDSADRICDIIEELTGN
jgi:UDP-N-acetylglucosamine--N-acetylmuramyl-(pentapeptide) pyrophosphoryl-undecaprenol N-acetylglucosamine transferase